MADNYIEKKMEEHRNAVPRYKHKITPNGQKPGFALLPYSVKTALIEADGVSNIVECIAGTIRNTGCRVAISCTDGEQSARRLACAYIAPSNNTLAILSKIWGEIELYIHVSDSEVKLEIGRGESIIRRSDVCDYASFSKKVANLCLYLTLPDSIGRVHGEFLI